MAKVNGTTTAEYLGAFARELKEEGIDGDLIRNLVTNAARHLLDAPDGDGLTVRNTYLK